MQIKNKKAQQALEYLITYGWGFLVILVVIGALAYFGILSPSKYLPESCDFGSQLQCYDYILTVEEGGQGLVSIRFLNNFGVNITVTGVQSLDGLATNTSQDILIERGEIGTISLDLTGSEYVLIEGEKSLIYLNVSFQRTQTSPPHYIIGSIYASPIKK